MPMPLVQGSAVRRGESVSLCLEGETIFLLNVYIPSFDFGPGRICTSVPNNLILFRRFVQRHS